METFNINRNIAHLAILQRIELASPKLKKIRKLFGRYLFTKFFSKYFINISDISKNYYNLMYTEFTSIKSFLKDNQNILSIGSGVGGLELLIYKNFKNSKINFIEKNYISEKIKYGWDEKNLEAYNDIDLLEKFLLLNGVRKDEFNIHDFDNSVLPQKKFDLILSLYSLDFHYKFEIYEEYLKEISDNNTIIIFDTIRYEYFKKIFKEVIIIKEDKFTVHKSKRILCKFIK